MIEITEKAYKYAEGKANEAMNRSIAQAYMDGYRDGYKDREAEIPVDLRDNKTEYVDLGLPSGTLWAQDYEMEGENILYLPYEKASRFQLPTKEQWEELISICKWEPHYSMGGFESISCIGPSGECIKFKASGYKGDENRDISEVLFWLKDGECTLEKECAFVKKNNPNCGEVSHMFSGYKLPIRQVC